MGEGRKNIHDFSQKFSVAHYRKIPWKSLLCFRKLLVSKNVRNKTVGGYHDFSYKLFCLTVQKQLVEEIFCVAEKNLYRKCYWIREEGLFHKFFSNFLSHSTKKIRRRFLLSFRKLRLSKFFMDKRRWGCITIFCQSLCLTVPKNFVHGPFYVSKFFWHQKILRIKKQGTSQLSVEKLMSHSIKKHRRGNLLCFGKKLISSSFMDKWGEKRLSRFQSNVFSFSLPKKFVEKPYCVLETFWYRKMLVIRQWAGITIFRRICFVSPYRNIL